MRLQCCFPVISDIKVKEPTPESLTKKKKEYMPPRFMSVAEASQQILEIIKTRNESPISGENLAVGLARVGSEQQKIIACSLDKMAATDLGSPLHSLIISAKDLHPLEVEFLQQFLIKS